jgi:hypothetical protein
MYSSLWLVSLKREIHTSVAVITKKWKNKSLKLTPLSSTYRRNIIQGLMSNLSKSTPLR